jgi:hypothetical protein
VVGGVPAPSDPAHSYDIVIRRRRSLVQPSWRANPTRRKPGVRTGELVPITATCLEPLHAMPRGFVRV